MAELIRFQEAAKRLGMAENTLRRRVREFELTVYSNPRDKRERLLDWQELEARFVERPIKPADGQNTTP